MPDNPLHERAWTFEGTIVTFGVHCGAALVNGRVVDSLEDGVSGEKNEPVPINLPILGRIDSGIVLLTPGHLRLDGLVHFFSQRATPSRSTLTMKGA